MAAPRFIAGEHRPLKVKVSVLAGVVPDPTSLSRPPQASVSLAISPEDATNDAHHDRAVVLGSCGRSQCLVRFECSWCSGRGPYLVVDRRKRRPRDHRNAVLVQVIRDGGCAIPVRHLLSDRVRLASSRCCRCWLSRGQEKRGELFSVYPCVVTLIRVSQVRRDDVCESQIAFTKRSELFDDPAGSLLKSSP